MAKCSTRVTKLFLLGYANVPFPINASAKAPFGTYRPTRGMPPAMMFGPGEPGMAHHTNVYGCVDFIVEADTLFGDLIDDWCEANP